MHENNSHKVLGRLQPKCVLSVIAWNVSCPVADILARCPHTRTGSSRVKYCDECVCMSVCLSTCISRKPHVQISLNFVYMLPVAVARFSHDSSAIHYVLQVLWITSFFHIMEGIGQNQRWHVYFIKFAKWWHRMDVRKRCLVKITRLLAALGRCLPSATAPCTLSCSSVLCCFVDMQF